MMRELCIFLTEKTNANFSYVQSDECTFIFKNDIEFIFNYRLHKIISEFVKLASVKFDRLLNYYFSK